MKGKVMKKLVILSVFLILACKEGEKIIPDISYGFHQVNPPDKSSVLPENFEIYVVVDFEPVLENVKFLVWREGELLPGSLNLEKVGNLYKVNYVPVEKEEGTYLAYFSYADKATFWTFFAEVTKSIPIFSKISVPYDNYKNFPPGASIFISEEKFLNFMTIDEETVIVRKKFLFESFEVPYDISFFPNSIILNLEEYESSRNYEVEVTGLLFLDENPGVANTKIRFRTIDMRAPYIKTCSPDFCVRQGSCSVVDSLRTFEIFFGDDEEIDPVSSSENLVVELDGQKISFGEVWAVGETSELILKNPGGTGKLYVFPNRLYFDFGEDIPSGKINIYILPSLSDTSGNSINAFFSWCIDIE